MTLTRKYANHGDDGYAIRIETPFDSILQVVASWGSGWEHVSTVPTNANGVLIRRLPTYAEMCWLKEELWDDDDWVVQFHPPRVEHVNNHPFCLHLWRSIASPMPTPPSWMVGIKEIGEIV